MILLFQALLAITIIVSALSLALAEQPARRSLLAVVVIARLRARLLAAGARDGAPAGAARVTLLEAIAVIAAGFAAGGVNAIVGSGSLITFPVLLAVGYPSRRRQRVQHRRAWCRAASAA